MNFSTALFPGLSDYAKNAERAYHAVYDGLDERRRRFTDQIGMFFSAASHVYIVKTYKWKDENQRIMTLATDAAIALRHAKIAFSEWFEIPYPSFTSEANTREIEIIQRTSDLLKEQGWLHLPELVSREDGREVVVRKTAAGVVDDMNAFITARQRLEAS